MPTPEAKPTSKELLQRAYVKTPERLWQTALGTLQFELPRIAFDTWIRDIEPIRLENDVLILSVANEYAQEIIESEHQGSIRRALAAADGREVDFQIVINRNLPTQSTSTNHGQSIEDTHPPANSTVETTEPDHDHRLEIVNQFRRTWEKIVDPEKVISLSRYFVKYWLPILGPEFSSLILAFKQLRFLQNAPANEPFQVYVSRLIEWQGISKSTFYRRIEKQHPLLSWFVEESPALGPIYEHPSPGQIRQKPNQYVVYAGIPLSPPHQRLVQKLLKEHGAGSDPDNIIEVLEALLKISDRDLRRVLEDSFADYQEKGNKSHPQKALTVFDILCEMLDVENAESQIGQVRMLAEELENKIVRPDQIITLTWYFTREWQSLLKSSAFWLIILLRSMGFYDKRTSEIRNTFWIDGGFVELGDRIGVSSETISSWFGGNRKSTGSAQYEHMSRFVQEIERTRGRNGNNRRSLSIKLSIEMIDPLTPESESVFYETFLEGADDRHDLFKSLTHYPEKWDPGPADSPELRDSNEAENPEKRDSSKADQPENWDSSSHVPPEFWDRIKDSINTYSTNRTKDQNTLAKTTTPDVNQLILPLIYRSGDLDSKDPSSGGSDWDLDQLLKVNAIPSGQVKALKKADVTGTDFVAWLLYAHSQEGRGIKKPAFFAAKRLLEQPPVLATDEWYNLVSKGPEYVLQNIKFALDPLMGMVDSGWGDAVGKVSNDRLGRLKRALYSPLV